jgi:hypothetical protein
MGHGLATTTSTHLDGALQAGLLQRDGRQVELLPRPAQHHGGDATSLCITLVRLLLRLLLLLLIHLLSLLLP